MNKLKKNKGSNTPGIDGITLTQFIDMHKDDMYEYIKDKIMDYHPKPVRRKMIPKRNGKLRPLGIPCIEDRIIQQCIRQVIEPICEAKFYKHSYGFRQGRRAEHALGRLYSLTGRHGMSYAIVMDIEGFFDNVDHTKLLKQLWHIGIQDRTILKLINKILKSGVYDPESKKIISTRKGTPQGGIISPLLANVVLNELDWFISKQWETTKTTHNYSVNKSKYRALKKSRRIPQFIIRYADDFIIITDKRSNANKVYKITKNFIENTLKLKVNDNKSDIVNLKKKNLEFLGFRYKLVKENGKYGGRSHMSKGSILKVKKTMRASVKALKKNPSYQNAKLYNLKVRGIINYYRMASMISQDLCQIYFSIQKALKVITKGQPVRYDSSNSYKAMYPGITFRTFWIMGLCLYPLHSKYVRPMNYSEEEFSEKYKRNCKRLLNCVIDEWSYLRYLVYKRDKGICKYTGIEVEIDEFDIHHVVPKYLGGEDTLNNLVLVSREYHQTHYKELHSL